MAIYLSHDDVKGLIRMKDILQGVEQAFSDCGLGSATNSPRQRLGVPNGVYRVMSGAIPSLGAMGSKGGLHSFAVPPGIQKGYDVNVLYSTETGELLALICTSLITDYRTGAMGAVSTKYLARSDANVVGVLGSGRQARTQLAAVALVRTLKRVLVYSPNPEHRTAYAKEMSQELGIEVTPTENPKSVVEGVDVLIAATNSMDAVFDGDWIQNGTHIVSIRSSHKLDIGTGTARREIDDRTVERSDFIAVDSLEQVVMQESPELMGAVHQERVVELGAVVAGKVKGRTGEDQITLFKSFGMGLQDVAASAKVYERAIEMGKGLNLP